MKYKLQKNNKIIIFTSILFCIIILLLGGTTAFFLQNDSANTNNIASIDKVTLKYTDNKNYLKENLIPAVEQDVPKFAMKNSFNDAKYTDDDICKFTDQYNACSLYEFTIQNTTDVAQSIVVSMSPTLNQYNNLYFILYKGKANELNEESKVIEYNRKIEQETIYFNGLNLVLNGNTSETYTIVFYIKNLDYAQDDAGKRFAASISVNSLTTGYNVSTEVGEGCYEQPVKLDDGTYKLTRFNGINHQTGDIVEGCGVTRDENGYYSVTVPSTYGGHTISTLGNSLFYPIYMEDFDPSDITPIGISKHYFIKELKINEGITTIEDGLYIENFPMDAEPRIGILTRGGLSVTDQQPLNEEGVKVWLPNSLKYLGDYAFNQTMLKEITLPKNLEYIGNRALANNNYITEISIPASVKEIAERGIAFNDNLTEVIFEDTDSKPSQLTTIGINSFYGNDKIKKLTIPSSVQTIGDHAFQNNYGLTKLTIKDTLDKPSKLTNIGEHAFDDCNLTYNGTSEEEKLYLPASITQIGYGAFAYNNNLKHIFFKGTNEQLNLLGSGWHESDVKIETN